MNLRQELELLRGEPIIDKISPEDVPCNEICDKARLCKYPLVSIRMLAFKHAKYIAQAIESIVGQQTDFEYELIISDDASPDDTLLIAREYQNKYPEKIRILWSEKNLHSVWGSSVRLWAACRGAFVAMCEGDDYWVDPFKLQKQVDAMRSHPEVSVCFGNQQQYFQETGKIVPDLGFKSKWPEGVTLGLKMALSKYVIPTPTVLVRMSAVKMVEARFGMLKWRLNMGDFQLYKCLSLVGDVYCHHDLFATYRIHRASEMHVNNERIMRDAGIVMYYLAKITSVFPETTVSDTLDGIGKSRMGIIAKADNVRRQQLIADYESCASQYPDVNKSVDRIGRWLAYNGYGRLYYFYMQNRHRIMWRLNKLFGN